MQELLYTHFPYCIDRVKDNLYIILNRKYCPLGQITRKDDLSSHPSVFQMNITPKRAIKLSYNESDCVERIYLFDQTPDLLNNKKLLSEYLHRLGILAKLKEKHKKDIK